MIVSVISRVSGILEDVVFKAEDSLHLLNYYQASGFSYSVRIYYSVIPRDRVTVVERFL